MTAFWALARMRLLDVLRSRSSAAFVVVFPVVLLVIVGFVFSEGHPFERRTVEIVTPGLSVDAFEISEQLAPAGDVRVERGSSEIEALGRLRARMSSAVIVPGPHGTMRVSVAERDRVFGAGLGVMLGDGATITYVTAPRFGYVHYLFPGVLVFSVMLSGLFATGHTLVLYRQNRFLKKLATTPIHRSTFVLAQVAARALLVVVQLVLLMIVGRVVFDIPIGLVSGLWTLGASLVGLAAFLGIGFLLACVIKTEDLVVDIISAVNLPLVFLSEIFFPLSAMPGPLRMLGSVLPSTAMVRVVRAVLLYGVEDVTTLAPGLLLMAGWAVVAFLLGLRLFRWHA